MEKEESQFIPGTSNERLFDILHNLSYNNGLRLRNQDVMVGCFYCTKIYNAQEITEFITGTFRRPEDTAICPHCSIDSVIPIQVKHNYLPDFYEDYFEITYPLLELMCQKYFKEEIKV